MAQKTRIKLLSFNIQVGIQTRTYRDYVTASWQHILPNQQRLENLHRISHLLKNYDFVALQEVDAGSLRSSFINQVEYLAVHSAFPYWYHQCNRNFGRFAKHSNGFLSKLAVREVINHKLPGLIPGRGAIEATLGSEQEPLTFVIAHLAISRRARTQQLEYLARHLRNKQHLILMGDLNCSEEELLNCFNRYGLHLQPNEGEHQGTYPSWQPTTRFDHILVTKGIEIHQHAVVNHSISDHLPIELEVSLPESILRVSTDTRRYHPVRITNDSARQGMY